MQFFELLLTSLALAMDSFSASICQGLSMKKLIFIQSLIIAAIFGFFQGFTPLLGYICVVAFQDTEGFQEIVSTNASLIAGVLLVFLGAKMLWDAFKSKKKNDLKKSQRAGTSDKDFGINKGENSDGSNGAVKSGKCDSNIDSSDSKKGNRNRIKNFSLGFNVVQVILLALATSIDACMMGFAFGVMQVDIVVCMIVIGSVTFVLSFLGTFIGHFFGAKWEKPATIAGGSALILLGVKFLLDFLNVI